MIISIVDIFKAFTGNKSTQVMNVVLIENYPFMPTA